jgi:ABC-type molybdate transport system substrate-binding protein
MKGWIQVSMALLIGLLVAGCAGTGVSSQTQDRSESAFPTPTAGPGS